VARLRRSRALVLLLEQSSVVGFDYLHGTRAPLSPLAVGLTTALADWIEPAAAFQALEPAPRPDVARELLALLDLGFVVVEGSPGGERDSRFERDWQWGPNAGMYHFGIKDPDYQRPGAVISWLVHKAATSPPVPMVTDNRGCDPVLPLDPPSLSPSSRGGDGLLALMARRRSFRGFDGAQPVPLEALRDVLFSGFAILGFAESGIPGDPPLPLAVTPSGGARNPFEAFVIVRAVAGLEPGAYHYDGVAHALGRLPVAPPADLADVLGGQEWFSAAGAVVLLVAYFERCTWKYPHPTGFRVVLLEAGHIAQNLLLAATAHRLAAAPTCAINDRTVEALLGLDRIKQAAVHAVALGVRGAQATSADLVEVRWNPRFGM
jgi:SagB-type dehydrogenase family enzyme